MLMLYLGVLIVTLGASALLLLFIKEEFPEASRLIKSTGKPEPSKARDDERPGDGAADD